MDTVSPVSFAVYDYKFTDFSSHNGIKYLDLQSRNMELENAPQATFWSFGFP